MTTPSPDQQHAPSSVLQQPPPSASEQVWCAACERTHPPAVPAPSTGATAGGETTKYLHWSEAGGPNECEHGYAEGIPCPQCDKSPRIIALLAELATLRSDLAHAQADLERVYEQRVREHEQYMTWRDERDHLRAQLAERDSQLATRQAVVDSLAAELHLQVHSVFTSWPQCTEPGCREAGATLDQAQPPRQQEVPD
jgi:multidrug efflux pump subunit AcrA (membrane-fusion protein)